MANKVNQSPPLPSPTLLTDTQSINDFITQLITTLRDELTQHAIRLNIAYVKDATEMTSGPFMMKNYVKAALPSASKYTYGLIMVTDDVGGSTPAFSDGTNWRRVADRNVIS